MTRNTADPVAVKAQNRRERRALERKREDVKSLWGSEHGRRYMWDLLSIAGIGQTPWRGRAADTDFHCGEQNMGFRILADVMDACPESYLLAMREAKKLQKREDDTELVESQTPEKEDDNA